MWEEGRAETGDRRLETEGYAAPLTKAGQAPGLNICFLQPSVSEGGQRTEEFRKSRKQKAESRKQENGAG